MKRMKLLVAIALPVLLMQNVQAQTGGERTSSSTTISRLTGIADWVNNGAMFLWSDSTSFTYGTNSGRGGDLTHTLKYDNEIKYNWVDTMYFNKTWNQQTFDASNNISTNQLLVWDTSAKIWNPNTKWLYYYDISNKMTSQIQQSWNGSTGSWYPVSENVFAFYASNNLFTNTYQVWNAVTSIFDDNSQQVYYYDVNNNMTQETDQMSIGGGAWAITGQYIYTYNTANKVLSQMYETWGGSAFTPTYKYTYTYDSVSGNMTSELYQVYSVSAGTWTNTTLHVFSSFVGSNPQTEEIKTWNDTASGGTWQPSMLNAYTYNSYGQMTSKTEESWNITGFYEFAAGDPKTNYYYETITISGVKDVHANANFNFAVAPVPAQNILNININTETAQDYEITITDMTGRTIRKWSVPSASNYSTTIPVNNLTPGNYLITANCAGGQITKQIIISK